MWTLDSLLIRWQMVSWGISLQSWIRASMSSWRVCSVTWQLWTLSCLSHVHREPALVCEENTGSPANSESSGEYQSSCTVPVVSRGVYCDSLVRIMHTRSHSVGHWQWIRRRSCCWNDAHLNPCPGDGFHFEKVDARSIIKLFTVVIF